jgi:hypothetical protein
LVGNYTLSNGQSGSIYGTSSPPDTATLALPTPYTSSGIGSAIPASALGDEATYTTTIPGTTVEGKTLAPVTTSPVVITGNPGTTINTVTTIPATTIPGTTIPPKTLTITTHIAGSTSTAGVELARDIDAHLGVMGAMAMAVLIW